MESMTGNSRKHVTDSFIQDEMPRGPAHLIASLRVMTKCHRRLGLSTNPNVIGGDPTVRRVVKGSRSVGVEASEEQFAMHLDTVQHIRQTAGLERGVDDDVVASSPRRAHTIPFPLTQALLLSATGWKAMLVPGGAMRISTKCEEYVSRPDVKVGYDAAGEFGDYYNGEVLDWSLKITGTNNETTRIEKTAVPTRRHRSKKPSTERVIHTNVLNRSKRNQVRSRNETRDNATGVSAPEHDVSARACRMMWKDRTHQLVPYDVSAVSFRTWLERDVRVKLPKDFRLSDDRLRCVMKALLLLSPGTSRERAILRRILRWSTDDVHETTDVERVEYSAEVKSLDH